MRIRIVSQGHGRSTNVLAVGDDGQEVPIHGVQAAEWSLASPRGLAEVKLTVRADVNVEGELTEWRPQRDPVARRPDPGQPFEDGMRLVPEGGVPVWAVVAFLLVCWAAIFLLIGVL